MTTVSRNWRASPVQPSGRPSGASFGLDGAESFCDVFASREKSLQTNQLQTPEYNLNFGFSGPTIGVHFNHCVPGKRGPLAPAFPE